MSLLAKIERYRNVTEMSATAFGRHAVNDPRLVHDIRRGRRPGRAMVARIEAFMTATGA